MRATFLILTLLLMAAGAAAHPLHLSVSEVNYNRDSGRIEVALRCFPDDLETVLSKAADRPVSVKNVDDLAVAAVSYLRSTWHVKDATGKPQSLSWAGCDVSDTHVWLFFEVPLPSGVLRARFNVTFMQDIFGDQLNSVQLRDGAFKQTLIFTRGEGEKVVTFK